MYKDNRGFTLIEVIIGLFLSTVLIGVSLVFLNPLGEGFNITKNIAEYEMIGNSILDLIQNNLNFATNVEIFKQGEKPFPYINNIYKNEDGIMINNSLFDSFDYDTELSVKIEENDITIYIDVINGDKTYNLSRTITVPYSNIDSDNIVGKRNILIDNVVISYNRKEAVTYDITTTAFTLRQNMRKFAINWTLLSEQERKDKYNGIWYANNSTFRNILRDTVYGGSWPLFPRDKDGNYPEGINNNVTYYIQPYIDYPNNNDNTNTDIIIFATTTQGDNWYTNLIYDYEQGVWYRRLNGGWSCNKSWADVKTEIHSDRWVVVKVN